MDRKNAARARERKLRAKYRRRIWIAVILCLIIGLALGFLAGRWGRGGTFDLTTRAPFNRFAPTDATETVETQPETQVEMPDVAQEDENPVEDDVLEATEAPVETEAPTDAPEETEAPEEGDEDETAVEEAIDAAPRGENTDAEVETAEAETTEAAVEDAIEATAEPIEPTEEPVVETEAPTPEPTVEPTPAPTAPNNTISVPFAQSANFSIELKEDGTVRKTSDADPYETLNFTMNIVKYLTNDYYQAAYGSSYQLKGTETSVAFLIELKNYTGAQAIQPNNHNLLDISLETASGEVITGNRVQDREIEGSSDITLKSNDPVTLYKRFVYDPAQGDMVALLVTTYENGTPYVYRFELGEPIRPTPVPEATYAPLQRGSSSSTAITRLQKALIEQGYLSSDATADGDFGSKTENAVKAAQEAFGMEATGVADHNFLVKLYGE